MMRLIFITIALFACMPFVQAQNRIVTGKVTDAETQEPLIGVSIIRTDDAMTGTITDVDGRFELALPGENPTVLKFIYLGYQDEFRTIDPGETEIAVQMKPSELALDEVVVTGYTVESRSKMTGAVTKLEGQHISMNPVSSLDQSLQGRVPGLYVATASGLPGTPGRVTIRGISSLQGENTNPLYIMDGVPIEPASFAALNAEDVESFSVLKDAASTAPYGSRAANGVIVITTKQGQSRASRNPVVSYQAQFGFSRVNTSKWDMMNSAERLQFEEILQDKSFPGWIYSAKNPVNPDGSAKTSADYARGEQQLAALRASDNRLRNKLLRTGFTQTHNLSLSGGTMATTYFVSAGYFQQDGVLYNSGIKRYNLRSNLNHTNGRFKFGLHIGMGYSEARQTEGDFDVSEDNPVAALYLTMPYELLYQTDGSLAVGTNKYGANALAMYQDIRRQENQLKNILSATLSYRITDYLKFTGTGGMDFQQLHNTCYVAPDSYFGGLIDPGAQGMYENYYLTKTRYIATGGLVFNRNWNRIHELEANLLAEANWYRLSRSGFTGYGLISGIVNTPTGITPGTSDNSFIPVVGGEQSRNALTSQIGLLRYTFDNKYTLTTSLRCDGSSQVPRHNRYKLFYAFGGTWNMQCESFLNQYNWLNTLKMRASWGRTGNASGFAGDFSYLNLYGTSAYGTMSALVPVNPGNPEYNWELNDMLDVGLDFELFYSRLRGGVDFYNRVTSNLFVEKRLSYTSGFETISTNAGKIRNRGIECYLEGDVLRSKDFQLSLGVNLAYNKNRILNLGDEDEFITEDYSINRVGLPLGHFYMVRWAGVDPENGAPMYYTADGELTYTYNPDNAVPVKGSFDPPLKGGFNLTARYKEFELSALFTFIYGMYRLNTAEFYRTSADSNYRQYNQSREMLNIWQNPGDVTDHPAACYPRYMTDRELQKADYLKLRNVQFSYTVPLCGRMQQLFERVRFFVQGQNLFTATKFKAFDPEDDNNWYQYEYPLPLSVTAGINIQL